MRRLSVSGPIGLAMLLAVPPQLQAAERLSCVTGAIDPKLNNEIFKAYRAEKDLGEALMAKVGDKIAACAAANDWSAEALESAIRVLFGQILAQGVLADLTAFSVDAAALQASTDKYLATLPPDKLRQFADGELGDEQGHDIVKQLIGDEVVRLSQIDEKLGGLIGEYAAARANETFFTSEFARQ